MTGDTGQWTQVCRGLDDESGVGLEEAGVPGLGECRRTVPTFLSHPERNPPIERFREIKRKREEGEGEREEKETVNKDCRHLVRMTNGTSACHVDLPLTHTLLDTRETSSPPADTHFT